MSDDGLIVVCHTVVAPCVVLEEILTAKMYESEPTFFNSDFIQLVTVYS